MEGGLVLVKPEAYFKKDFIVKDIEEYGLSIDQTMPQRWTREKIRQTYPSENYSHWPMAIFIDNIYFGKFGKDPMVEVMLISSEADTIKKIKKLVGPLDASIAKRPEDSSTLRYKYGLRESFSVCIDGKPYYLYFNGIHSSSKEDFKRERKIYFPEITL